MKISDRYSLLCISVSVIILMMVFVNGDEPGTEDEDIIGIAYDIRSTQSGYSFSFEDTGGGKIRCFTRTEPVEYGIYSINGGFSDDGGMFFINSIRLMHQNELYHN
ncbi:MAG: hypothetical protein FWG41_00995 [Methanomassiliicoccaceae archaeon]|nr:hypothetical protein [Methanomassiliicoccaceae archaeon]